MSQNKLYPFSAIVGQDLMKESLVLNIVDPSIGGVLISGEKGTGKSTAVRAIADLVGYRDQVESCIFNCDPMDRTNQCDKCLSKEDLKSKKSKMRVVELPVSATEDRVVGTIDIEKILKEGEKAFEPGVLARANRNILYVDEINLLDDHIVDLLLDSAAMGVNRIEREGISYEHPARFILIGTMNPEEGDLRPQLLDRFGISINITGEKDIEKRIEVIKRRIEFEKDQEAFIKKYRDQQERLARSIKEAQRILKSVEVDDESLNLISRIAIELDIDGHRGDITMLKVSKALAALNGSKKISHKDIKKSALLALPHRMRKTPFDDGIFDYNFIEKIIDEF